MWGGSHFESFEALTWGGKVCCLWGIFIVFEQVKKEAGEESISEIINQ